MNKDALLKFRENSMIFMKNSIKVNEGEETEWIHDQKTLKENINILLRFVCMLLFVSLSLSIVFMAIPWIFNQHKFAFIFLQVPYQSLILSYFILSSITNITKSSKFSQSKIRPKIFILGCTVGFVSSLLLVSLPLLILNEYKFIVNIFGMFGTALVITAFQSILLWGHKNQRWIILSACCIIPILQLSFCMVFGYYFQFLEDKYRIVLCVFYPFLIGIFKFFCTQFVRQLEPENTFGSSNLVNCQSLVVAGYPYRVIFS
eukprot:c34472_g1_i1.p1 GENE.c34472_g1_i1~~c34472_g1_i1.p1  ORF type:complete len:270 (+),score=27.89 c34472_g1_i1:32-811(+)